MELGNSAAAVAEAMLGELRPVSRPVVYDGQVRPRGEASTVPSFFFFLARACEVDSICWPVVEPESPFRLYLDCAVVISQNQTEQYGMRKVSPGLMVVVVVMMMMMAAGLESHPSAEEREDVASRRCSCRGALVSETLLRPGAR